MKRPIGDRASVEMPHEGVEARRQGGSLFRAKDLARSDKGHTKCRLRRALDAGSLNKKPLPFGLPRINADQRPAARAVLRFPNQSMTPRTAENNEIKASVGMSPASKAEWRAATGFHSDRSR